MLSKGLDFHLSSEKQPSGPGNCRNGKGHKAVKPGSGEIPLDTPRDRDGTFEPLIVPKRQRRIGILDSATMTLYRKGMTTRDIQATVKGLYGAGVPPTLVSEATQPVTEEVREWQDRPLDKIHPIVWLGAIAVKAHRYSRVVTMGVHIALGVDMPGHKELLGMWVAEAGGAKSWAQVLPEISSRGVRDASVSCVDSLAGFPQAIKGVSPNADVQLCLAHMMRQSLAAVPDKDRKAASVGLNKLCHAASEGAAREALEESSGKWDAKYPSISRKWRSHWEGLITIFKCPHDTRKVIYTTNATGSLNMVIRKGLRGPADHGIRGIPSLAVNEIGKKL
jgi:putative transposase